MKRNQITIFTNFGSFLDSLLDDFVSARHHIHMQFFKFESDNVGRRIGEAMASRAAEGVKARLLYDDLCCQSWRRFYRSLEGRGIETAGYEPVRLPVIKKSNYYRNHRKTVVIDGHIAYLGGMNVADRYLEGLDWGCWRDTMIRIEGPAAADVQHAFLNDWNLTTRQHIGGSEYYPEEGEPSEPTLEILTSDPTKRQYSIMKKTTEILNHAQQYVWMESPYFIPPPEVKESMLAASQRGVDLRILQPPRGDRGESTQLASKRHYSDMMSAGAKIGTYNLGFLHSKLIVCDDRIAVVSSCNIDPRSYILCHEIAAIIHDEGFSKELSNVFLEDERNSTYIDPTEWKQRSILQKTKENLSSIIASQL